MGALLHDVGKIGIPEAILNKPGPLTDDEFDVMKRHTVIGADIIASIPGMDEVVALVRSSHERWDGRGYPDGLAGLQVPRGSYVIAVCDAYHAMTEDRVYRKGMSAELALQELRRCSGTQFMPAAVEAIEQVVKTAACAGACASPKPRSGFGGRDQAPAAVDHPLQQPLVGAVPAAAVDAVEAVDVPQDRDRAARCARPVRARAPTVAVRRRRPGRGTARSARRRVHDRQRQLDQVERPVGGQVVRVEGQREAGPQSRRLGIALAGVVAKPELGQQRQRLVGAVSQVVEPHARRWARR